MLQRHNYVTLLSWRKNAILEEMPVVYENSIVLQNIYNMPKTSK